MSRKLESVFLKEKISKLLPVYAWLPLTLVVAFNMVAYYLIPAILGDVQRYDLSIGLDRKLPLLTWFISFYILAYVQWIGSYWYHCSRNTKLCYEITTADLIGKILSAICFIAIPTAIVRPEIVVDGFFDYWTDFIYFTDKPINLFPSIHCLESWICFRGAMMLPKKNKFYIAFQFVFTLFVFASTVFVKQHFVIDIPVAVIFGEIGIFISTKCNGWKMLNAIQPKSLRV